VNRSPAVRLSIVLVLLLLAPPQVEAQDVTTRSPNLAGGWVGTPGTLHFNFDHRFWLLGKRVFNSPTFQAAVPVREGLLLGGHYASNSRVSPNSSNEWEVFGRWAPGLDEWPIQPALTAGYNVHAGSVDGELSVAASLLGLRLLGAARAFSDTGGSGESSWFTGGGVIVPVRENLSLAGDLGRLWRSEGSERRIWGLGLQLRIPTTPHTLSLRAANTRTGTLQGSTVGGRTTWGFEFTIPITVRRYFRAPATPPRPDDPLEEARPLGDEAVDVTMTDDLRFDPQVLRIRSGQTVVWRNTTDLPHTVTAHPERVRSPEQVALPEGAEPFDSGFLFAGEEFRHTFTVPGEYVYICIPHDQAPMVGTVVVEP
jgi:plastocyanin